MMAAMTTKSPLPTLLDGVDVWPLFPASGSREAIFLIGHKELDRYVTAPESKLPVVRQILTMLDGSHSLEEIDSYFLGEQRKVVRSEQLYRQLTEAGLMEGSTAPEGDITKSSLRLLSIPIAPLLKRSTAIPPAILSVAAVIGLAVILFGVWLTVGAWFTLLSPVRATWSGSTEFLTLEVFGKYAAVCAASVLLHELAHALAGARFGLIANSLEFALYMGIIPIVYLRIPGLYTLTPRRRVVVWSAGIFLNLILAAIGMTYLIWHAGASATLSIWYVVVLVNYSLVVTNLIPFLPTDAYFILSTVLHVHNIRRNAMRQLVLSVQARRLRVSPIGTVYLVFTVLLLILTLWRDVILLARLPVGRVFSADIGSLFLILPWALLAVQIFRHRSKLFSTKGGTRGVLTR